MQPADQITRKALVLAGGKSRRMGHDKAAIRVDGVSLLARTVKLAAQFSDDVFVGVHQISEDATRSGFQLLVDAGVGQGPLDSILTALEADHAAEWLILACDMPLLDSATLQALTTAADENRAAAAVAMANTSGELPEPLCAIWRAPMRSHILGAFSNDRYCARKCLINADASLVEPANPHALLNMNRDSDLELAVQHGANIA